MSSYNALSISGFTILAPSNLKAILLAGVDLEDIESITSATGMTGLKYREQFIKAIAQGLQSILTDGYNMLSDITKSAMVNISAIAIGMLLGTVGAKRTLVKNLQSMMDSRLTKNDPLGVAYQIIEKKFRTYVNEKDSLSSSVPSVKYASSLPDYSLLGVCILNFPKWTFESLSRELGKSFSAWPDFLRKQWVGNFFLSVEFQQEHKQWERYFWTNIIKTSKNASNTSFKAEFTEDYYANTVADKFLMFTPSLGRVTPSSNGYSKRDFAMVILAYFAQFGPNLVPSNVRTPWTTPVTMMTVPRKSVTLLKMIEEDLNELGTTALTEMEEGAKEEAESSDTFSTVD